MYRKTVVPPTADLCRLLAVHYRVAGHLLHRSRLVTIAEVSFLFSLAALTVSATPVLTLRPLCLERPLSVQFRRRNGSF